MISSLPAAGTAAAIGTGFTAAAGTGFLVSY